MTEDSKDKDQRNILGLSTDELTGLTETDLVKNPTAIRMLLHYYNQLVEENSTLKNNVNTLQTYQSAYEKKETNAKTGTILISMGSIFSGFSATFISLSSYLSGVIFGFASLMLIFAGIYFSLFKDNG